MGAGWGIAAFANSIWVAVPFIVAGAAGNGAAIVCNQVLVQRGAPDRFRGRALATIMSSNYLVLGLAMAGAGLLTSAYGARWVWVAAGAVYFFAAGVALVMTRWMPVAADEQEEAVEIAARAAASTLDPGGNGSRPEVEPEPERGLALVTSDSVLEGEEGSANGLERIASLLERIERRREHEARRTQE